MRNSEQRLKLNPKEINGRRNKQITVTAFS